METITRDVSQMKSQERSAAELLVGHALREHERVIVHVLSLDDDETATEVPQPTATLPDWCNVYAGMTDQEIDEVEQSITRCDPKCGIQVVFDRKSDKLLFKRVQRFASVR